ncbi:hypothetical protein ACH4S8_37620 [Streptomyces sp. NPDC021080]|uniref:hypothetical protein n=1 Tax=Streptomyces sp. NPDC021080 TaxID=3365110 RepID=UPI00379B6673
MADQWGADVPVSMPQPLPAKLGNTVPMGGFVMTENGLFHDLSAADHARLSRPSFAPFDPASEQIRPVPDPADDREHL